MAGLRAKAAGTIFRSIRESSCGSTLGRFGSQFDPPGQQGQRAALSIACLPIRRGKTTELGPVGVRPILLKFGTFFRQRRDIR
jgi:hypothetical protein